MTKASMRCCAAMAALLAGLVLAAMAQPGSKVKVGYCGALKDIDAVKAAGFDYMEVRTSEVARFPMRITRRRPRSFRRWDFRCCRQICFFPQTSK